MHEEKKERDSLVPDKYLCKRGVSKDYVEENVMDEHVETLRMFERRQRLTKEEVLNVLLLRIATVLEGIESMFASQDGYVEKAGCTCGGANQCEKYEEV